MGAAMGRLARRTVVLAFVIGMALWFALRPVNWQNWLGFSKAAYFTLGQNYAFLSGFGPCLITGLGLSTLIVGGWHHLNCHEAGCPRIGRHHVNGQVWCHRHHENARPERTENEILLSIEALLKELTACAAPPSSSSSP
jgi:hypothetical protein